MKLRVSAIAAMLIGAAPVIAGYVSIGADPVASCVYFSNKPAHQMPPVCAQQAAALLPSTPPARTAN
jgi:hypothetical protein